MENFIEISEQEYQDWEKEGDTANHAFHDGFEQGKAARSEWTDAKESAPKSAEEGSPLSVEVLVYTVGGHYHIALYDANRRSNQWLEVMCGEEIEASHWMPLPAPPAGNLPPEPPVV